MKKVSPIQIVAIMLIAGAVAGFNFDDPSWEENDTSYMLFIGYLLLTGYIIWSKKKKDEGTE